MRTLKIYSLGNFLFFFLRVLLCHPGWSAMVPSRLTATSTLGFKNSPTSASQVAGITGACHHNRPRPWVLCLSLQRREMIGRSLHVLPALILCKCVNLSLRSQEHSGKHLLLPASQRPQTSLAEESSLHLVPFDPKRRGVWCLERTCDLESKELRILAFPLKGCGMWANLLSC